uniref:Uncharacterized protein n=1 Tax=Rhizophora mucronata TaxID=61149 RepID=A0A2P2JYV8_RHIMU
MLKKKNTCSTWPAQNTGRCTWKNSGLPTIYVLVNWPS